MGKLIVRRWAVAALAVALGVNVFFAPPASAGHTVRWGVGSECGATQKEAFVTVNDTVRFVACTTLEGEPLAGHPFEVRVVGPAKSVNQAVAADNGGRARFAVKPTVPGDTTVTLCDADGCVYGTAVIHAGAPAAAPVTTTAPTPTTRRSVAVARTTAPASAATTFATTPSVGIGEPVASTAPPRSNTTRVALVIDDEGDSSFRLAVALLFLGLATAFVVLWRFFKGRWPWMQSPSEPLDEGYGAEGTGADKAMPEATPVPMENSDGTATIITGEAGQLGNTTSVPIPLPVAEDPVLGLGVENDQCDWLVVYGGPGGEEVLRTPRGRRCCSIRITVETTTFVTTPVVHRSHKSPTRLYAASTGLDVQGLDLKATALVNEVVADPGEVSGPGDLVLEEEVALDHVEATEVTVSVFAPCAPRDYRITADGSSSLKRSLSLQAGDAGPTIYGAAGARSFVADGLVYQLLVPLPDNPEVETLVVDAPAWGFFPGVDESGVLPSRDDGEAARRIDLIESRQGTDVEVTYRHEPQPAHAEIEGGGALRFVVWNVAHVSGSVLYAGDVPQNIYARASMHHQVDVSVRRVGSGDGGHDVPEPCGTCGASRCRCSLHLDMTVGPETVITVDGQRFRLTRAAPTQPSVVAWSLERG